MVIVHGPRDVPAVALTFDDGPGAVTPAILDVLARHGARATFNVLGTRVRAGAPLIRRALADGHEIGLHGWRHRDLTARPAWSIGELLRARAAVSAVTGAAPRVFRPPYGATSPRLELTARALGLVTVTWDVDPRDWQEPGAETIRRRVRDALRPGSIVLLHDDRPGLAPTAAAVDGILDDLAAAGLAAVTVSALLTRSGRPAPALARGRRRTARARRPRSPAPASSALRWSRRPG